MLRRSFRAGLMLGLLAGAVLAVVKMMQGRRESIADTGPAAERRQPPPPPAPPAPARPPSDTAAREERATVVRTPVHPPDDVPHEAPTEREAVRPATTSPDRGIEAVPVRTPSPVNEPDDEPPRERAPAAPARKTVKKAAKKVAKATKKAATATKAAAKKATTKAAATERIWIEPSGDSCPSSHPIKAKLSSRIFHAPGQLNYDRTAPDRCYRDPNAAEADGLRPAKR